MEFYLKIMASVVGILLGMSQLNKPRRDPKVELKNDLEILNLLGKENKHYSKLCEEIDEKISWIYPTSDMLKKMEKEESVAISGILSFFTFIGFLIWTYNNLFRNFTWWFLLTGIIAYFSFMIFIDFLKKS